MTCPACGSPRVYASRLRNLVERARAAVSEKQPYRCHACGWREWRELLLPSEGPETHPDDLRTGGDPSPVSPKDLDQLDPALAPKP